VIRLDAAGAVEWLRDYGSIRGDDVLPHADGGSLIAGVDGTDLAAARLDADGEVVWAKSYPLHDSTVSRVRVTASGDGGWVLASTQIVGPELDVNGDDGIDDEEEQEPPPLDTTTGLHNVMLTKIDASGAVLWYRLYGGLYSELATSVATAPNGGYLVSGQSDSVGDYTDAWLLRVGPDGLIAQGCNAYRGPHDMLRPGEGIVARGLGVWSTHQDERYVGPAIAVVDTNVLASEPSLVTVARQCAGTATDGSGVVATTRRLTVRQAGERIGVVTSVPRGIACGVARQGPAEGPADAGYDERLCSNVFADGTLVTLRVDFGSIDDFASWGPGCELVLGAFGEICSVRVDADKTIDVSFGAPAREPPEPPEPPGPPPAGNSHTLTISVSREGGFVGSTDGMLGCGGTSNRCVVEYAAGAVVGLYAVPLPDARVAFETWAGDCSGGPNLSLSMNSDYTCTAVFASAP
jgi:hypothetical protein